jgi:hypothetical protein
MHDLKENGSLHGDRPQVQPLTNEKGNSHYDEENRKLRQRIQTLEDAKTVSRKSISLLEAIQVGVSRLMLSWMSHRISLMVSLLTFFKDTQCTAYDSRTHTHCFHFAIFHFSVIGCALLRFLYINIDLLTSPPLLSPSFQR